MSYGFDYDIGAIQGIDKRKKTNELAGMEQSASLYASQQAAVQQAMTVQPPPQVKEAQKGDSVQFSDEIKETSGINKVNMTAFKNNISEMQNSLAVPGMNRGTHIGGVSSSRGRQQGIEPGMKNLGTFYSREKPALAA